MKTSIRPMPYRLQRWRGGALDREFSPEYADFSWARETAEDYAGPGDLVEVIDTNSGQVIFRADYDATARLLALIPTSTRPESSPSSTTVLEGATHNP